MENIKQLEKEIEKYDKNYNQEEELDFLERVENALNKKDWKRLHRDIDIGQKRTKLQTLQKVCEEIKKLRFTEKGDFWNWDGEMSYSKNCKQLSEELLKKFQGEENDK